MEHAGGEDVAARHAQARWGHVGRRLLDDAGHVDHAVVDGRAGDDAVALRLFGWHFLHCENRGTPFLELIDHLLEHRRRADHQVVGQQHRERVVADQSLRAQHRVAESERLRLAHVDALHVVRLDAAYHVEQFLLTRLFEGYLELESHVKVVFDRPLVAAGDENHFAHTGGIGFLNGILNQRLVDHRHHFLRLRLGGGEEAGAQTGHGKDRFVDQHFLTISETRMRASRFWHEAPQESAHKASLSAWIY